MHLELEELPLFRIVEKVDHPYQVLGIHAQTSEQEEEALKSFGLDAERLMLQALCNQSVNSLMQHLRSKSTGASLVDSPRRVAIANLALISQLEREEGYEKILLKRSTPGIRVHGVHPGGTIYYLDPNLPYSDTHVLTFDTLTPLRLTFSSSETTNEMKMKQIDLRMKVSIDEEFAPHVYNFPESILEKFQ